MMSCRKRQRPYLSVIIVTWNSEADIDPCLHALKTALRQYTHEVFVVDNVSSDATVSVVRKHHPWVTLLPQKTNWGFGQGNNIGLKKARGTYIWLLNPDTKVNEQAVRTMTDFLDTHPDTGVVGPEQYNAEGKLILMKSRTSVLGLCEYVIEKIIAFLTGTTTVLFPYPHRTTILNAGCILARSMLLPTKQWFNPDCFLYGEEEYLFRRVKAKKWKVFFLRNCSIIHYREKSIGPTGKKLQFALDSFILLPIRSAVAMWRKRHQL